jgi:hypothetical protein
MGTRNLVAKNDLYYVGQLGMTGSVFEQEKNRAGVDEGDWHCIVLTEWAVAMLVHVSDVVKSIYQIIFSGEKIPSQAMIGPDGALTVLELKELVVEVFESFSANAGLL